MEVHVRVAVEEGLLRQVITGHAHGFPEVLRQVPVEAERVFAGVLVGDDRSDGGIGHGNVHRPRGLRDHRDIVVRTVADERRRPLPVPADIGVLRRAGVDVAHDLVFGQDVVPLVLGVQDIVEGGIQGGVDAERDIGSGDVFMTSVRDGHWCSPLPR